MSTRLAYFIPLIVAAMLIGMFARGLFTHREYADSPLINKPLPAFSLPMLGKQGKLSNETLKGQYSLLNVFASWCVSCRIEHPYLMSLGKQIPIYGIAWKDKEINTANWLQQHGNPYTEVGMDIEGKTILDLGVTGAPETFLISPEGKVLFRYPGPLNEEIVEKAFLPLIKEGK